jgi:hypothetical protein
MGWGGGKFFSAFLNPAFHLVSLDESAKGELVSKGFSFDFVHRGPPVHRIARVALSLCAKKDKGK